MCSLQKASSNWGKNQVQQTSSFQQENVKNEVQIDRGQRQKNLFTMTSGSLVITVRNNSLNDSK